jgi:putative endonuclease
VKGRPRPAKAGGSPSREKGGFKGLFLWLRRMGERFAPDLGISGERAAERHLRDLGYAIRERNYRVRGGEADLIAEKDGLVVVVEVKTRSNRRFGAPAHGVTPAKARRVLVAATSYCRRHGLSLSRLRVDVVAVERRGKEMVIRHYPGAVSV